MDEDLSWRAKLARANINILNVTITRERLPDDAGGGYKETPYWYYEFMYHPRPGQTKWSKTFFTPTPATIPNTATTTTTTTQDSPTTFDPYSITDVAPLIIRQVATLRRELEETTYGA